MVNQLAEYIKTQLQAGYTLNQVKDYLFKYGYAPEAVDQAVKQVYEPEVKHVIHLSKATVATVFAVVLILVLVSGGAFFLFIPKTPQTLMDVNNDILVENVETSGNLDFIVELSNLGAAARFDVVVTNHILDYDASIIKTSSETIAVETKASKKLSISLLDVPVGNYFLQTIAEYDGKQATASNTFKIFERTPEATCFDNTLNQDEEDVDCGGSCVPCPSCTDGLRNQDEEDVDCGGSCQVCPTCTDGIKNQDELGVDCGGSCLKSCEEVPIDEFDGLSIYDKLDEVKVIGGANPTRAVKICDSLETQLHQDTCYSRLAEASLQESYCSDIMSSNTKDDCLTALAEKKEESVLCDNIDSESKGDMCLMHFATADIDYSVCERVTNKYLKQSCNSLKRLSETDFSELGSPPDIDINQFIDENGLFDEQAFNVYLASITG
jgi:hypothetical protein